MNSLFEVYRLCHDINETHLEVHYHCFKSSEGKELASIFVNEGENEILHEIVYVKNKDELEKAYNSLFGILYEAEQRMSA